MAAFLAELLFDLIGSLVLDWLRRAVLAVCAWFDPKVHGRVARLVVGILLGIAGFLFIPVVAGLLGL